VYVSKILLDRRQGNLEGMSLPPFRLFLSLGHHWLRRIAQSRSVAEEQPPDVSDGAEACS
jgi:hypothetical protein